MSQAYVETPQREVAIALSSLQAEASEREAGKDEFVEALGNFVADNAG